MFMFPHLETTYLVVILHSREALLLSNGFAIIMEEAFILLRFADPAKLFTASDQSVHYGVAVGVDIKRSERKGGKRKMTVEVLKQKRQVSPTETAIFPVV